MKYVIIGNSAAGIGAVEGIRQIDKQGEITIISDEKHHTYSRPLISYLLLGKTTREGMKYRNDDFYSRMGCRTLFGIKATEIKADAKQVLLDDGSIIAYDRLLVATGSSPFVPPFKGLDTVPEWFTFMNIDDAIGIGKIIGIGAAIDEDTAIGIDSAQGKGEAYAISNKKRVLIVGAGLIGLKCAEGISKKVGSITVVDLAPRILSSILDEEGAGLIQDHLENNGITFRLSTGINCFDKNKAVLDSGEEIEFDILVIAAGVRPNTQLLKGIADIDRGIVINERSETSAKDIYSAGDCTQAMDVSSGQTKIMALLPSAYMQGECAGINMAGGEKCFDKAIPMNAIGLFGRHIITAGNYSGLVYAENDNSTYKRLFYDNNRLNGYILIGNVEKAGIYTSLIRERTPLDCIDFALICEKPGLMAFTREERKQKLGGVAS